jgi:hypothetical protein
VDLPEVVVTTVKTKDPGAPDFPNWGIYAIGDGSSTSGGGGSSSGSGGSGSVSPVSDTTLPCITAPPINTSSMNSYLANVANAFFGDLINGQGLSVSFATGEPPSGSNYYLVNGLYYDNHNMIGTPYPALYLSNNTIYISPSINSAGINYIIAEIGHELIHAIIIQKKLSINSHTQEYLAVLFQSQIWAKLGNIKLSNDYLAAANSIKDDKQKYPDFNSAQADDFQTKYKPAAPLPPCK